MEKEPTNQQITVQTIVDQTLVEVPKVPLVKVQLLPMSAEHQVELFVQELPIEQPLPVQEFPIQVLSTQTFKLRSHFDLNLGNESQANIEGSAIHNNVDENKSQTTESQPKPPTRDSKPPTSVPSPCA
ncbi:unnamed protein product [Citrullus colocynthis]|uniref:Uncharacterized protein n=1 Tax=Citrullus colocynthis TaxID=252529 RepID=A0ABP0XUA2_9ROSI